MSDTSLALLYACAHLDLSSESGNVLVIGGYDPLYSKTYPKARFLTNFAEDSALWRKAGHTPCAEEIVQFADIVMLDIPQQSQEGDYMIARALTLVKPDGIILAGASNLTGGKSLPKRLAAFGCPVADLSKHKCRVAWTQKPHAAAKEKISEALNAGGVIQRSHDSLFTQPGVFSWKQRDVGTDILLRALPLTLSGKGADFGCGLGEISRFILQHCPDITHITCIDHDHRAIECCRRNLSNFAGKSEVMLRDIPTESCPAHLDFIVMNPPFHIGKTEDKNLGRTFITKAANSLKSGGILYMVANTHLPYEDLLQSHFKDVELLAKENGFKIFKAVR